MFINYEMATIEITKTEAKEAGKYGSEMYLKIADVRSETGFKVVVKDTKRKKDTMKGLTYAYMEVYIEKKAGERKETLLAELKEYRGCIDGKSNLLTEKTSYGEVKAWFLEQFPEITEFNEKMTAKRASLREEREKKKLEALIA
jgi:molybdopterin converting factor small subunit